MKVKVAVLGSMSLIVLTVSVHVKHVYMQNQHTMELISA